MGSQMAQIKRKPWIYKKGSRIKERLHDVLGLTYSRYLALVRPIDGRPVDYVFLGYQNLDLADLFVDLGDGIFPNSGGEVSTIARVRPAWGKLFKIIPSPSS